MVRGCVEPRHARTGPQVICSSARTWLQLRSMTATMPPRRTPLRCRKPTRAVARWCSWRYVQIPGPRPAPCCWLSPAAAGASPAAGGKLTAAAPVSMTASRSPKRWEAVARRSQASRPPRAAAASPTDRQSLSPGAGAGPRRGMATLWIIIECSDKIRVACKFCPPDSLGQLLPDALDLRNRDAMKL